jgi:hypothetical protein
VVQVSTQIYFYKSYIVYNSIVGWPTINKKKINVMLHFGIVVVKHFSFYKSKTFRFISCFHSITFKNQFFLHFYFFVSLFKSYACASCIESFMSHSHFFN